VRPPRLFHRSSFPPANMPSVYPAPGGADFCHAIVSPYGSLSPLMDTRQISRGKHASFRTRAQSIPTWPKMGRGLYPAVSGTRPTRPACRRFRLRELGSCSSPRAFAVPCLDRTTSSPSAVTGYPVAIPLYRCRSFLVALALWARLFATLRAASIRLGLGLDEL